jgi:hypothetical protein
MARNISGHGMTTPMENEPENSSFRLSTEMGAAQVAPSFDPAHLHAFGTCVSLLYWTGFVVKRGTMHIFQQCEQGL